VAFEAVAACFSASDKYISRAQPDYPIDTMTDAIVPDATHAAKCISIARSQSRLKLQELRRAANPSSFLS